MILQVNNYTLFFITSSVLVAIIIILIIQNLRMRAGDNSDILVQSIQDRINEIYRSINDMYRNYGEVTNQLKVLNEISNDTKKLSSYLTNTKIRGSWGERMVEDIIRLVGMKEGINYKKHKNSGREFPDFTFFLPNGKELNVDAKFPLNNYINYVNAYSISDKEKYKKDFIRDIRSAIKSISSRNYINENTLDFAVVFIANEAAYSFLMSEGPEIVDEALKSRIVVCSPNNLYAILSIVNEASRYYTLERKSREVIGLMRKFINEWQKFSAEMEKTGKKIEDVNKQYGKLSEIKSGKLERVLTAIDNISAAPVPTENNAGTAEVSDRRNVS